MKKQKPQVRLEGERPFKCCPNCLSGWITTWRQREGFVPLPSVVRCSCWTAHMEALAAERGSK